MRTVTYKCDRCGKEDADNNIQLWRLKVSYQLPDSNWDEHETVEWCRSCAVEVGVIRNAEERAKNVALKDVPLPTITDLIREICNEEIEASKS